MSSYGSLAMEPKWQAHTIFSPVWNQLRAGMNTPHGKGAPVGKELGSLALDPKTGNLVIPAGESKFALGVGLWDDAVDTYVRFVQHELSAAEKRGTARTKGSGPGSEMVLSVKVQIVPRPDNAYNPNAISVAAPPEHAGTDIERHLGYMYDRNLVSLGGPLRGLVSVSDHPVCCHAFIGLTAPFEEQLEDEADELGSNSLHVRDANGTVYWVDPPRLMLPWWEDLQAVVIAYSRQHQPHRILPFVDHWASWKPGTREELARRTEDKSFAITLRADGNSLAAYYEEIQLAELMPSSRDFFDHTMQRVRKLGGVATAHAEEHQGALKVFVESHTPLPGSDNSPVG
ncbi:hypothetical protein ACNPQM_07205 [Streptomyces sp. NPDC056231]|uniref:hypothetical protein n=1 Tax=Streptomyces sp. NPDC056231 TaxID=3345755 RepID=UPI003AADCE93